MNCICNLAREQWWGSYPVFSVGKKTNLVWKTKGASNGTALIGGTAEVSGCIFACRSIDMIAIERKKEIHSLAEIVSTAAYDKIPMDKAL